MDRISERSEGGIHRSYAHAVVYVLKEKKFRERFKDDNLGNRNSPRCPNWLSSNGLVIQLVGAPWNLTFECRSIQ